MELHSACTEIKINTMKNAECMMFSTISITVSDIMIVLVSILCSSLFRNLRFLQKALHFLGIPRTLAQVGAAISTVARWGTVEMAAPTWARAKGLGLGLGLDRIQRVCVRTFRSALRFLGIPRRRRFLKSAEYNNIVCNYCHTHYVFFIML